MQGSLWWQTLLPDQGCVYGHVTGCATQDFFSFFFLEEEFVLCPLYECPGELSAELYVQSGCRSLTVAPVGVPLFPSYF